MGKCQRIENFGVDVWAHFIVKASIMKENDSLFLWADIKVEACLYMEGERDRSGTAR